jgi:hypothetical protein
MTIRKLESLNFIFTLAVLLFLVTTQGQSQAQTSTNNQLSLTQTQASHFAALAMKCIQKEFPNKLDHVNNDAEDVRSPRTMPPAFYGCFDWHSTVHGHWWRGLALAP